MLQVLFRIQMTVAGLPLWTVLLVAGVVVGAGLWLVGRKLASPLGETLAPVGRAVIVASLAASAAAYYFRDDLPNGVPIYGFGMMLFLAFLACTWLGGRRGEREGIANDTMQDLAIWIFGGGLLGARITFLMMGDARPQTVGEFLSRLPRIWDGGIILYGSVIGALLSYTIGYWLVFRRKGVQTRRFADAIAPCITLGLMFGRTGCFLNGCCYGGILCASCAPQFMGAYFPIPAPPRDSLVRNGRQTVAGFTLVSRTDVTGLRRDLTPIVEQVDPASAAYRAGLRPGATVLSVNGQPVRSGVDLDRLLGYLDGWERGETIVQMTYQPAGRGGDEPEEIRYRPTTGPLYPTQLFEVVSMGLLMLVLLAYEPFRRNPGQVAAVLMVCYGVHRFLNEILRDDDRPIGFERYGSLLLVVGGVLMWSWLQWRKKVDDPVRPVGEAAKRAFLAPEPSEPVAVAPGP